MSGGWNGPRKSVRISMITGITTAPSHKSCSFITWSLFYSAELKIVFFFCNHVGWIVNFVIWRKSTFATKLFATKYCFLILGDDTSFFFFISLFFVLFYVIINIYKNYFIILLLLLLLLLLFHYFFSWKLFLFFHVWGCSGIFRNVPTCSGMFRVPDFIDAQ